MIERHSGIRQTRGRQFALPLGIKEGVEPSEKMDGLAKRLNVLVHKGVAEHLPLADRSFDFVLMVTTVCFVGDILKSFRVVNRILKPGGRFVIGLVDQNSAFGGKYQEMISKSKFDRIAWLRYGTVENKFKVLRIDGQRTLEAQWARYW